MKLVHLQQGTPAWAAWRATRFGSSEAAAMLGLSPYCTRSELLRMKHTGLEREFSDWTRRNILDHGHAVEAATRPLIEEQIGDELSAVVCEGEGRLAASCDGLDFDGSLAWECKQWNEALAAGVQAGRVPDTHMPQCQHILLVTGAQRLIFTVSDGAGRMVSIDVLPDPEWFERLRNGWAQFERDLASYVPPAAAEPARAEPMESLPAVAVRLDGALSVAGNLPTFAEALKAFISRIPAKPATDNEFATVDAACKALKKAEEALDAAEAGALASITDVEAMRRAVADCRKLARDTRLAAEKLVERRKLQIKEEAIAAARAALDQHIAALQAELAPMRLQPVPADFAGAIKGLRSIASMQDALDTTLANAKIAADGGARVIRGNVAAFKAAAGANGALHALFPDLHLLVHKAADDFAAVLDQRITKHRADEAERERKAAEARAAEIAAAEERAREQERARLAAEQRQREDAEAAAAEAQRLAAEHADRMARAPVVAAALAAAPDAAEARADLQAVHAIAQQVAAAPVAPAANEPATLKLGVICERLGFAIRADFLADVLHIPPRATDKAAKLYRESDWPVICAQLQAHISAMTELYAQSKAA